MTQDNRSATTDPTNEDNLSRGYTVDSIWVNQTGRRSFVCTRSTIGEADWEEVGTAQGVSPLKWNMAATTDPGASDNADGGYGVNSLWFNKTGQKIFLLTAIDGMSGDATWTQVAGVPT